MYFVGWILIFTIGAFFFDFERYQIILFSIAMVAWLVLKVVTDRQEKDLYQEIDELSEEEYDHFLRDAESDGLIEKRKE